MPASTIPDHLTPEALRKEADRRELAARHAGIQRRGAARNAVVDALIAIDSGDVRAGDATEALRLAIGRLKSQDAEDRSHQPTNGDVARLGRDDWWDAVVAEHPHVEPHDLFRRDARAVW